MVLIFPFLIVITAIASFTMFQFGLPLWLPIVSTVVLVIFLIVSICLSRKQNRAKPIIIYGVVLLILIFLMIVFRQQISGFVESILSPIGPGALPDSAVN